MANTKVETSIGAAAASAVVNADKDKTTPVRSAFDVILTSTPKVQLTAAKEMPRKIGWGAAQQPHPEGGTRATIASVRFPLDPHGNVCISARINRETFLKDGKTERKYGVTIAGLDYDALRNVEAVRLVASLKVAAREAYLTFIRTQTVTQREAAAKSVSDTSWTDADVNAAPEATVEQA